MGGGRCWPEGEGEGAGGGGGVGGGGLSIWPCFFLFLLFFSV